MKATKKIISWILIIAILSGAISIFSFSKNSSSKGSSSRIDDDIDFSKLTMACLGDSLTMANADDNGKPYWHFVKSKLGLSQVYNYGGSWSTVAYMEDCHCHPDSDYNHDPLVFRYNKMIQADILK